MPRPKRCRRVGGPPGCKLFKPAGIPASELEEIILELDEAEALRLADAEGLYQEEAAARMGVSRPTFGRIVASARKKVATALVEGHALRIEGGVVEIPETRRFTCGACEHEWDVPFGTGRPRACPACDALNLFRVDNGPRGCGGGRRRGRR